MPMAGAGTAGDKNGKFSHLHRFLTALKHSDDRRDGDSQTLASYIEAERRDLDAEAFSLLDRELQSRITLLAKRCVPQSSSSRLPPRAARRCPTRHGAAPLFVECLTTDVRTHGRTSHEPPSIMLQCSRHQH